MKNSLNGRKTQHRSNACLRGEPYYPVENPLCWYVLMLMRLVGANNIIAIFVPCKYIVNLGVSYRKSAIIL